jgi:hypothetical protein
MGPDKSFFYFGPQTQAGYIVYGNGPSIAMRSLIRQKKDGSTYIPAPIMLSSETLITLKQISVLRSAERERVQVEDIC